MADSKLEQLLDTLLSNWNDLFGRFGKDSNDGSVVTEEQVTAAALAAGNEIYKNGLSPSVVAAAGYRTDEFNDMFNQVSKTSVNASAHVSNVEDKELMVNPVQLAALEDAEDSDVAELVEDIQLDSSFVPAPTEPKTDDSEADTNGSGGGNSGPGSENSDDTLPGGESEDEDDEKEDIPSGNSGPGSENSEDAMPGQDVESEDDGNEGRDSSGLSGKSGDDIIDNAVTSAQTILGDVVTTDGSTDAGQPSPGPVLLQLSYTLHPADGPPVKKDFTDLAGLVQGLTQDAGNGVKVELNDAAFDALKSVGLIDPNATTNPGIIDLGGPQQQQPPATVGVDVGMPPVPSTTAAPSWPSPEQEEGIQAIFKQYVGRPADVNDLSIHAPRVAGGLTLDQLRAEISAAPEAQTYRENVIKSHFLQIVGRPADSEDLRIHSERLASGQVTVEQFRNELLAAPESQTFKASMMITDSNGVTRDLYNFAPGDRDAAKNHIANGGTFSQLDSMAGILNSGDQQAVDNWNNFVSNGGKLNSTPPPLGGSGAGSSAGTSSGTGASTAGGYGDAKDNPSYGNVVNVSSTDGEVSPLVTSTGGPTTITIPVSSGSYTPGNNFVAAPGANTTSIPTATVSPGAGGPSTTMPSTPSVAPTLDVGTRINDFLYGGYGKQ